MDSFAISTDSEKDQPSERNLFHRLRQVPRPKRLVGLLILASVLVLPVSVYNLQNRQDALQSTADYTVPPQTQQLTTALNPRKGLAFSMPEFTQDKDLLNVGWYYKWNFNCPADDPTCINMAYDEKYDLQPDQCKPYIMFLNEPNNGPPNGSNTEATIAAQRFTELEAICPPPATQFIVGNVANPGYRDGGAWLISFLNEYKRLTGNNFSQILGTHCYEYDTVPAGWCSSTLGGDRALYSGPMWVTEFNSVEFVGTGDGVSRLTKLLNYIEKNFDRFAVYTHRQPPYDPVKYGWVIHESVELVYDAEDGALEGQLTPKGQVYADFLSGGGSSPSPSPSPSTAPGGVTFVSIASEDGQVLESSETSSVGGSINSSNSTFKIGDNSKDKQFKGILSFDTASIPDTAAITSAKVKIRRQGLSGTDPFTTHGNLILDLKQGKFGNAALEKTDFESQATLTNIATFTRVTKNGQWAEANLPSTAFSAVNTTGKTQVRVYFTKDDNDDLGNDYLSFTSGNSSTSSYRPVLEVVYQ